MVDVYEGPADFQKISEFIEQALKNVSADSVKITVGDMIAVAPAMLESAETGKSGSNLEKLAHHPAAILLDIPEELLKNGTLRRNDAGVVVVGKTRVPLDTVIYSFQKGYTPEEIIQHFTTLTLVDVYAVIAYYLRERPAVDAYIRQREQQAAAIRQQIEMQFPSNGLKDVLLARLKSREEN